MFKAGRKDEQTKAMTLYREAIELLPAAMRTEGPNAVKLNIRKVLQTKLEAATKRLASLEQQLPLSPKGGQEVMSSAAWRSEKAKQSSPRVNAGAAVRVAAGAGQAQGGYRRSHRIGHHGPLPLQACPPICLGNGISAALTAWVHRAGARKGDARACAGQAGGGWCGQ
jgi:hypothetical protein